MKSEEPVVIVTEHSREQLLTVQEFACLVRVHPLSIYRLIREEKQPGVVRVGRHIRINAAVALSKDDLSAYQRINASNRLS